MSSRISYTLLPHTTADGSADVSLLHLNQSYLWPSSSGSITWTAGAGILSYKVAGNGGITVLRNGSTSTPFYRPSRTSTSQLITLTGGLFLKEPTYMYGLDLIITGLLSEKRAFSLLVYVNWNVSLFGGP